MLHFLPLFFLCIVGLVSANKMVQESLKVFEKRREAALGALVFLYEFAKPQRISYFQSFINIKKQTRIINRHISRYYVDLFRLFSIRGSYFTLL